MPPCGALVLAWALISTGVLGGRRASTSLPDAPNLPFDCHLARRPLFGVRGESPGSAGRACTDVLPRSARRAALQTLA